MVRKVGVARYSIVPGGKLGRELDGKRKCAVKILLRLGFSLQSTVVWQRRDGRLATYITHLHYRAGEGPSQAHVEHAMSGTSNE